MIRYRLPSFCHPGMKRVHLKCHLVPWPMNGVRISPLPIISWANGSRMVGGAAKAGVQLGLQGEGAVARLAGDSPESLTTTEADPESRVLGFLAIHVYVPSWAAVMPLMFRWSWSFLKARPLKAHTYSGSGQYRDTHHSGREVLKSTLMVQPVRAVESWSMATRSGPTVRAGGRETGQWRERAVDVGTRPAGGAPGKT